MKYLNIRLCLIAGIMGIAVAAGVIEALASRAPDKGEARGKPRPAEEMQAG